MKKILIIRLSSIGDVVLTTPVIRCVKQQTKDAEIHFLVKKNFATVLEANPYVDNIHVFDGDLRQTVIDLKRQNFDFVIDLHKNLRSLRIKRALGAPSSAFDKLNLKKWLLVNFKRNKMPDIHIVDRYMDTVAELGVKNDNKGLDYFIPDGYKVDITSFPKEFHSGYIGIVIGGAHATKVFPENKLIELIQKIEKPVVLLGGPLDSIMGNRIVNACPDAAVFNSCGKYHLHQSASLVEQADKIISNDTGLMHIAAAFKKDIISIWGNTVPSFGMYPYVPEKEQEIKNNILEVNDLPCRPCSKIGYDKCPKGHFKCMNNIKIEDILSRIK
ncbi:MAG: glycosyltransferase family 9 protein [Hyphomicrobiales bacterium]